jgi:hypothetical protein
LKVMLFIYYIVLSSYLISAPVLKYGVTHIKQILYLYFEAIF